MGAGGFVLIPWGLGGVMTDPGLRAVTMDTRPEPVRPALLRRVPSEPVKRRVSAPGTLTPIDELPSGFTPIEEAPNRLPVVQLRSPPPPSTVRPRAPEPARPEE